MSTDLRDQSARDRFIRELDRNFCVSAGAGVGKTTAIVERVAQLALHEPAALSRLVVVTYTKAAADELRVRARALVLEQLAGSAHVRQNLLAALRSAFFGTIHSFCLKLVREHGRFLGLPQNVDLLEENDREDLWARFCESAALDALPLPAELLRVVLRFLTFQDLLSLAEKIDAGQAAKIIADFRDEPQPVVTFAEALSDDGGRSRENTRKNQEELRKWICEFQSDAQFLKLPEFKSGSGSFKENYAEELAPLARWLGNAAARIAAQIALGFRDFRRDERLMTYADQIAWAQRLIANEQIVERLRTREFIVILDEAQDTDAGMFSILTEITRPRGARVGEWPQNKLAGGPEPGRFCFVGDEQQAIYASRADLGTYREYLDAFAARSGGEPLEFSVTMRCPQRVIEAVNAIFFHNARLQQTHLAFRELFAKPNAKDGAAWLLPIEPLAEEKPSVETQFRAECAQVAKFLLAYKPDGLGVHRWSDIAILCPRHKWLATAAEIFSHAGIPCRLLAEKKIQLELAQCSWPAALFYVLANPWDRFELIGVLREIFAVSDVDLANAQVVNQPLTFWSKLQLSPRLDSALKILRKLREAIPHDGKGTISRFVDHVFDETQLAARLTAIGESPTGLDVFRQKAMQAECDGASLREWVNDLCSCLRKSAETAAEATDEMQILTCQKAKGLEWPVVIPLGLGRRIGEARDGFPRIESHGREIAVHLCAATVDPEWKEDADRKRDEEFQRVLYVTLTRAKSLLILPDSSRLYNGSKPSFFDLCKWPELDRGKFLQSPSRLVPQATEKKIAAPKIHVAPAVEVLARAVENSKNIPQQITPSELGHEIDLPEGEPVSQIGGADYGIWWHATMQHFPWLADSEAQRSYVQRAISDATDDFKKRAAHELRASAKFREQLRETGKHFLTEIPFSHPRSAREWLEGVIDLVVITRDEGLWIVDWKTDRRYLGESAEAFAERLRGRYHAQLEAYAEVLRDGMCREISRIVLYSTELGDAVS